LNPNFREFSGIKRYMDDSINQAREQEYVETILGRDATCAISTHAILPPAFRRAGMRFMHHSRERGGHYQNCHDQHHRWLQKEKLKTK